MSEEAENGDSELQGNSTSVEGDDKVSREELLELVRAIKFAKPDASQRQVHSEITEELSQKEGFEFLRSVPLNEVKKVWKKALQDKQQQQQQEQKLPQASEDNADLIKKLNIQDKPPQLFTVGTDNSVKFLVQDYTAAVLVARQQAEELKQQQESQAQLALARDYVHVFLDVPADKSGSRPHQALINFQSSAGPSSTEKKGSIKGNRKKKGNKKKAATTPLTTRDTIDEDGREIVKIQCAAPLSTSPSGDAANGEAPTQQLPMLLYNQSRSHRTFIHPDADDDSKGYRKIQELIRSAGQQGVLGAAGGTKAYFYARLTIASNKGGKSHPPILSIDVTQLAETQSW